MVNRIRSLICLLLLAAPIRAAEYATDRVVVKFRPNAAKTAMAFQSGPMKTFGIGTATERARKFTEAMKDYAVIHIAPGTSVDEAIRALKARGDIEYAGPSYIVHALAVPNDTLFATDQWSLKNTGQNILGITGTSGDDIKATKAWDITTGNSSIIVAIVDSGIDYNHPDLTGNMWHNTAETPGNGTDDDGDGIIDDYYGANFIGSGTSTGDPFDDNGHGTHVAGIVGARGNNATDIAGVNWNVQLMALKFLDSSGNGATDDAAQAISYAVSHGASIINNSWGVSTVNPQDPLLRSAVDSAISAGVIVVAAAGNSAGATYYPGVWPGVISVSATDNKDQNYNATTSTTIALGAPGIDIKSTLPSNQTGFLSGTSMASPHVAGVCALMKAVNPSLTPAQALTTLKASVDVPSGWNFNYGAGRLNAYNAVLSASDTTPPTVNLTSPAPGSTVNGTATLSATASDDAVVTKVWFLVDGVVISTDTAAPYSAGWDTTLASDGTHTLTARAFDGAGHTTDSNIDVVVGNADPILPSVAISSPAAGAFLSGTGPVTVTATDNNAVTKVWFLFDGVLKSTDTSSPYSWTFDTTTVPDGTHTISAQAFDTIGNTTSTAVTITVANPDVSSPTVTLTGPAANAQLYGPFTMTATATDDLGVARVQFLIDGVTSSTDTTAPYSAAFNSLSYSTGTHTLTARAFDFTGNMSSTTVSVTFLADTTAPTITVTGVADGSRVNGIITLGATVSDDIGVVRVELYIDGVLKDTDLSAPFSFAVDTVQIGPGPHTASLKAIDGAGNATSAAVAFTVGGYHISPFQPLFDPARGESVSIPLNLGETLHVEARLLDRFGALVATLADGDLSPGTTLTWDGRTESHDVAASGTYLLYLDVAGSIETRKIIVRK